EPRRRPRRDPSPDFHRAALRSLHDHRGPPMSSDTDHLRDVTEPYGSTGPGDAGSRPDDAGATARETGSTLPPPPARPVSAPVGSPLPWASTAPGDTRPVAGGRAIDWPSAPPSGPPGPGDRPREDDVPSWVPRFEQP